MKSHINRVAAAAAAAAVAATAVDPARLGRSSTRRDTAAHSSHWAHSSAVKYGAGKIDTGQEYFPQTRNVWTALRQTLLLYVQSARDLHNVVYVESPVGRRNIQYRQCRPSDLCVLQTDHTALSCRPWPKLVSTRWKIQWESHYLSHSVVLPTMQGPSADHRHYIRRQNTDQII